MTRVSGYQALLHFPVPSEAWVNDVWIVPITIEEGDQKRLDSDPLPTLYARQPKDAVLNGYDEAFVGLGGFYETQPARGHGVRPVRIRDAELARVKFRTAARPNGDWIEEDMLVTEARLFPLWTLSEPNEALEQGVEYEDVPHSFDPNDILDMPGTDFQGIHLEADLATRRVQMEIRQGWVALRRLAEYRDSLQRGRVRSGWILQGANHLDPAQPSSRRATYFWEQLFHAFSLSAGENVSDLGQPPEEFGVVRELPLSFREAAKGLTIHSKGSGKPWPDIDASKPRNVIFPPGTVFPTSWPTLLPEGF